MSKSESETINATGSVILRDSDAALKALAEFFSDPKFKHQSCFRYPVNRDLTEAEREVNAIIDEVFGPNQEYEEWLERLRKLGLVSAGKT